MLPIVGFLLVGAGGGVLLSLLFYFWHKDVLLQEQLTGTTGDLHEKKRALSLLYTLYDIILESLDLETMTQKIADVIPHQFGYHTGVLSLIDEDQGTLIRYAASNTPAAQEAIRNLPVPFRHITIPLSDTRNMMVRALKEKKRLVTTDSYDVFVPALTRDQAQRLQSIMNINTTIVFPIFHNDTAIGTFLISTDKKEQEITPYENEVLTYFVQGVGIALNIAHLFRKLEKMTQELTTANAYLKKMDAIKDEFITITSHELRTPMTAVKSYAWMLANDKAGPMEDKAKEYSRRIYLSADRLIRLVNEMLDVSHIESGNVRLKTEPFDMVQLIHEVKEELHARIQEHNLTLEEINQEPVGMVFADREKIRQVLINLVGNATKFTPAGGHISIWSHADDGVMNVSVADTGRGIAATDLPKLFTKFGRLGDTFDSLSEHDGNGLGLYLCKTYVELNSGTIKADSTPGKGTTFSFTLPLYQADAPHPVPQGASSLIKPDVTPSAGVTPTPVLPA